VSERFWRVRRRELDDPLARPFVEVALRVRRWPWSETLGSCWVVEREDGWALSTLPEEHTHASLEVAIELAKSRILRQVATQEQRDEEVARLVGDSPADG
jgi:hypothetical protein